MRKNVAIAFLLGLLVATYASLLFRAPVPTAADAIQSGGFVGVAGNAQPGAKDLLWLVDTKSDTPHLVCYQLDQGRLAIAAARNIRYDFMLDQWPANGAPQSPTVAEVFKLLQDSGKLKPAGGGSGTAGTSGAPAGSTGGASGH